MRRRTVITGLSGLLWPGTIAVAFESKGSVSGTVAVRLGRKLKSDASDVVVYIDGVRGDPPDASNLVHEIRQIDRKFVPRVSAVLVGTEIAFPNDDKVYHNVFSNSETQPFDLGLYASGKSEFIIAERTGHIEVQCDRHHEMEAYIVVRDTPHFVVTKKDGRFTLRGVPPGRYVLVGWLPPGTGWRREIDVVAGQNAKVDFEVVQERPGPRRVHKDGTPYRGYP